MVNVPGLNKLLRLEIFISEDGCNVVGLIQLYECHSLFGVGFYLKSRSDIVRLVSCLPKSNKGLKDDYLIVFREWHDSLHCLTREGELGGVP